MVDDVSDAHAMLQDIRSVGNVVVSNILAGVCRWLFGAMLPSYIWYNWVTEYHFRKAFLVPYPTCQAIQCYYQGWSQAEMERETWKVTSSYQCSGKINIVMLVTVNLKHLANHLCITVFVWAR